MSLASAKSIASPRDEMDNRERVELRLLRTDLAESALNAVLLLGRMLSDFLERPGELVVPVTVVRVV